jgi:WhiB family redox-sensing transcriptional regulator
VAAAEPLEAPDVTLVHLADLLDCREWVSQAWRAPASCRGVDVAVFMPERGESLDEARAYCRGCDVELECLEYAMSLETRWCHDVWGGSTGRDRRDARRRGWSADQLLEQLERDGR